MINQPKHNRPPIISQQMMPQQPQRPQIPQRPPIAQPGKANEISAMMKWLVIGVLVFFLCVLALIAVVTNFTAFGKGAGAYIQFVWHILPYVTLALVGGWLLKQFKKEVLQGVQFIIDKIAYTGPARSMAKAKVKHVEALTETTAETRKLEALSRYELVLAQAEERKAQAWQKFHSLPVSEQNSAIGFDPHTGQYVPIAMPQAQFPAHLHALSFHNAPRVTGISEETPKQIEAASEEVKNIHIPTFGESMNAGLIGPGQKHMLICYQLERDEATGQLTGAMEPYQIEKPEDHSTNFIGGTGGSGKTTFMAHLCSQGALMNALFYIIDPHLTHPEKSIAVKLDAMKHAFILPPAMSTAEIYNVYRHAEQEAIARMNRKETPYSGRPIFFVVDEVLNILGRAQRTNNPEELAFWRDFVLFLRDLGTQYNKFGMNGMFASQYVTKEAFKIPRYQVDFRDGCQSQTLFRLPPNQAQAMRLLESSDLRGARRLPQGHGYIGFMNGDVIRMASGNVTKQDIQLAAMQTEAVPNTKLYVGYSSGTQSVPGTNGFINDAETISDEGQYAISSELHRQERTTGDLGSAVNQDVMPVPQSTEKVPEGTARPGKQFDYQQELEFVRKYSELKNIKRVLAEMHLSYGDYQACASRLVQKMNLR